MNASPSGLDELFHAATDTLRPDVDLLVAGGLSRGRTRRRRARIGTAVAGVAVIGVLGGTAVVVPHLVQDSAPEAGVAADPTTPAPAIPTHAPVDAPLTIAAADIPGTVDLLLGTSLALPPITQAPYGVQDTPREKTVHFLYDGMLTTVTIRPAPDPRQTCHQFDSCDPQGDGSVQAVLEPGAADGVTVREVSVFRHGYEVSVLSYNAAAGKDAAALAPEPPLTVAQLLTVAGSEVWFS